MAPDHQAGLKDLRGLSHIILLYHFHRSRGRRLTVAGIDILDGTPLLDIKPCVSPFDHPGSTRVGWLARAQVKARSRRADERFK